VAAFSEVRKASGFTPSRVIELPATAWAETWQERPRDGTRVGIRTIPDAAKDRCREAAAREALASSGGADEGSESFVETYNAALMRAAVAVSLSHPDDTSRDAWEAQETIVRHGMTSSTVARLYDEIELLEIATSPTSRLASDAEALAVFEALRAGALDTLSAGDARFVRRLLGAIGERLGIPAEA
jgi:hypothetical protein